MISNDTKSKLRRLMELRQDRDEKTQAAKVANEAYIEMELDVYEAFEDDEEGVEGTLKVNLGDPWGVVSFRTRETYYGRIIDDEAALEYFAQRAMVDEISAPKFVKKRINEIVRDHIEQGIDMPPGIDYYPQRGMTVTRQKG